MRKEEEEYIRECDCPEIQQLWKPKPGDEVFDRLEEKIIKIPPNYISTVKNPSFKGRFVFLPSLEWLVDKMSEMFKSLDKKEISEGILSFTFWEGEKSPRLACIKSLKKYLKTQEKR